MIKLTVNGRTKTFRGNPFKRLIDVLREDFRLTGTKEGCSEGECGACTVLVDDLPVNSCLVPVCQMDGHKVETIESLGTPDRLHILQEAFLEEGGTQCGICTPGMVLTALAHMRRGGASDPESIREALAGNLCRCTGYQHIVDSVVRAVATKRKTRPRKRK
jgi:carbon-monoxide dehydrogenase small subunit